MALKVKERLLLIAITISIGVSSVFAWNRDAHRYENYDLDRGPVFYEAYYPDGNEEARGNYQEKRFLGPGAVLEKTYQLPSQRLAFPEDTIRLDDYQNRAEGLLQNVQDDRPPPRVNTEPLDIKEISNLARRAISRDLENWNALESYLDRAKYQDLSIRRRMVIPEIEYGIEQSPRRVVPSVPDSLNEDRDLRRQMYDKVFEEPSDPTSRVQSTGDQGVHDASRRLTARDIASRDTSGAYGSVRYQSQQTNEEEMVGARETSGANMPLLKEMGQQNARSIADPYPPEDIFAPRPQVINYIFSRKPIGSAENKGQSVSEVKEESVPRNYGDNLIRDEIKKEDGKDAKDVKVTSIEISEMPRHKTRHHHGEWPKRDYSKHH